MQTYSGISPCLKLPRPAPFSKRFVHQESKRKYRKKREKKWCYMNKESTYSTISMNLVDNEWMQSATIKLSFQLHNSITAATWVFMRTEKNTLDLKRYNLPTSVSFDACLITIVQFFLKVSNHG